ncbi:hypothetical protein CRG98_000849 [Punica granatum]|uniref:Uncharacterized protein n=1 Tax=Punica granatum TaxID=22663 RepID=A0A2I0LDN3_PUNGR|nr:hypothetical protein CRG98_000849 [Punica granatum]
MSMIVFRPLCLLEHLSLDNETGLDPPVATPPPLGGRKGANWCAKHIKAVMNIAPAFLGVPNTVTNIISIEGRDIAAIRAMAHGVLDSEILGLQMLKHFMRVCRTWDSGISLIPKGGETILGDLDWSPEEGFSCGLERSRSLESPVFVKNANNSEGRESFMIKESANFIISFSRLLALDIKELSHGGTLTKVNSSCQEVWTEYDEMSGESIRYVADNKAYTSRAVIDLLRVLAPEMMKRGEAHFSHGIADNLDNPKYNHYRYCSNPLEMKLPNAPEMEYMPRRGWNSHGEDTKGRSLLRGWGRERAVNQCQVHVWRRWRRKTRFNPSGMLTYVREYRHRSPASLLEGRGWESGAHVDIMGNVAMIEDVLRVAAGASGTEIGGDIFTRI